LHHLEEKDRPKDIRGGPYSKYLLVVHRDETALKKEVVESWLAGFTASVGLLDEVLLLLSYEPPAGCPVLDDVADSCSVPFTFRPLASTSIS